MISTLLALSALQAGATPSASAHQLVRLHAPIASFGAAATDDAIYVLGGHVGGAHEHSRANLAARFIRVPLADPEAWEELEGGVGYQSVALVAHAGEVYRVGGMYATNAPDEPDDLHSVNEFMRYRPEEGDWVSRLELPGERSSHDAIVRDGTLYVFGGWKLTGSDEQWYSEGWALDLDADDASWEVIEQPFERRALAVASALEHLFVIGGLTADGETSSRVDAYDPASGEWKRAADLPVTGFGATAYGLDEGLFFLGRDGNLWRLAEVAGSWELVISLALPRFFARLVPAGDSRLAIVAGATPQGRTTLMEIVPSQPRASRTSIASASFPFPGHTRQRQAAFIHDGELFLFGGNRHAEGHRFGAEDFSDEGWAVDLLTGDVRSVAPFPARRQSMVASPVANDESSVFVGGGYGCDEDGPRSYDDLFLYNAELDEWEAADLELPFALSQFGMLASEHALWTVGGMAYHPDRDGDFAPGAALYRWSFGEGGEFARAEASLLKPRRAFGWARIQDALFVVGGMTHDFEVVAEPERVDLATGAVEAIASPAFERIAPSVAALGDKLYVTSGTTPSLGRRAFNTALECYDPANGQWETLADSLPLPSDYVRVLPWGERLVAWTTAREGRIDLVFVTPPGARPAGGGFRHP